jgi:cytochrome c oxidase subunit I
MSTDTHLAPPASLAGRLAVLPSSDRRLCRSLIGLALVALGLGLAYGLAMALARSGALAFLPDTAYRLLTLHGTTAFFYWLYLAQAGLMIVLAAGESERGISLRPLAWAGTGLMVVGFAITKSAVLIGTPLLYDANPALGLEDPGTVAAMAAGYLLLAAGLVCCSASGIATVLDSRREEDGFSALGFGVFAWAGFLIVSALAAVNAFLPNLLWGLGLGAFPAGATTEWHILFHNMHYLPLMATVLVWYAIARALTGTGSIFGARFSKIVFASYLVFAPPTSLYHMFLEPNLPESVRVAGSLLSLFVSVPTLTAFLIVVSSLEAHARAQQGGSGTFGWMRRLPWRHPAMANMGAAMAAMLVGLAFAFVLIQEKLAPLLSDTIFVPAYFHFFAVGTITQTFLAGFMVALPALNGRPLWRPKILNIMPWLVLAGLLIFGAAGIAAGFSGVPRRTIDVAYDGAAPGGWGALMAVLGFGSALFAAGLTVSLYGVARTLLPALTRLAPEDAVAGWTRPVAVGPAWTGPLAVLLLVVTMYVATIGAFELMHSLPVAAEGGGGH